MRNSSQSSNVIRLTAEPTTYGRRYIAPIAGLLTCLMLIKHRETDKALLVSDNGVASKAVWVPKSWLMIEPGDRGMFLVATLSKRVAEQRDLHPRFVDGEALGFSAIQFEQLHEANALAARKRNQIRGNRGPLPYPGRNAFA